MKNSSFMFKGHEEDLGKGEAKFYFSIELESENIDFTETISFPPVVNKIPQALLKAILNSLMLILGISYWKLYCPKEIVIRSNFLTKEQAKFWNTVYTKGLGEFFYKNKLDFRGLIRFPFDEKTKTKPTSFPRSDRSLLPIGGGKDSIVSGELLKENNKPFDVLIIGNSDIQTNVARVMGKNPIIIERKLDPKLFELNKKRDVYNGHIPVSVIYAFLGLMAAVFYDYAYVVVSNEKSANYGNVEYLGQVINHQWSKSEEFEKLFQDYVTPFITPDAHYFSLLRALNELKITELFSKHKKYFDVFSSCNTNFKIKNLHLGGAVKRHLRGGRMDSSSAMLRTNPQRIWCGKCAKCVFVFTLLAAYLSKDEVVKIFGKNLFEDKSLLPVFQELLGVRNFKPFECVGTPEEMKIALEKIKEKGEFSGTLGV